MIARGQQKLLLQDVQNGQDLHLFWNTAGRHAIDVSARTTHIGPVTSNGILANGFLMMQIDDAAPPLGPRNSAQHRADNLAVKTMNRIYIGARSGKETAHGLQNLLQKRDVERAKSLFSAQSLVDFAISGTRKPTNNKYPMFSFTNKIE